MSMLDVQPVVHEGHKGGGLLGTIVGGVTGLIAGLATMNPEVGYATGLGTAAALAGAGSTIGSVAGEAIDPSKGPTQSPVLPHTQGAPMPNRLPLDALSEHPELQMAYIQDAKQALPMSGMPQADYDHYNSILNQAHQVLSQRLGVGNGL